MPQQQYTINRKGLRLKRLEAWGAENPIVLTESQLKALEFELFLHLNAIEHTRTRIQRPQTNPSVERLNQTIQDEFYSLSFCKKLYRTIEEIQPTSTNSWCATTPAGPSQGVTARAGYRCRHFSGPGPAACL